MAKVPGSATDPFWYKDAIVYQTHVRCFFDSNNDGVGDFAGLTQKLDYLHGLGITALWLLPFYPSPLRDDGYDIARYEDIHPSYGTVRDFRAFMREAHERNIQVITELVINHTSDQHPWFRAARRAPAESMKRSYYVWSDTEQKYPDVRIIFTDSEKSNWTWDPVAQAYYWHRFFFHQPDLNFDNPHVRRAVMRVMRFWFNMGVDGMRLDAVPYLIERDGTNCENLPETHDVLKEIRRALDDGYESRMLLAEANQWPADVRPYFGDGDEAHMAFHFPLMPRIFMALRQEDRHPITEILRQTPDIPENCQWALFLRNHDELTLEMVTDEERDYMYQAYAADPQMRINVGIRRRLAPLMENSRPRIELLNSLLFSFPGTPILYYGDELGMGDNVYLGDRNGVRTPMQWTSDRNAGFSRVDPARLYAPVIMDPVYGYQAINVEAQERSPYSLLNWMKRLIALRKQHKTFGRGTIDFLHPANRKILAYRRRHDGETILCVANLSRSVQPVELNLSSMDGLTPIEMLGQTEFPPIGQRPYFLTLAPYGFYWFLLERAPTPVAMRVAPQQRAPIEEMPPLFAGTAWDRLLEGNVRTLIERDFLIPFLRRQRWFGGKGREIRSARITDWAVLARKAEPSFVTLVNVDYADSPSERYFVPLALRGTDAESLAAGNSSGVLARVTGARKGILLDAVLDDASAQALLDMVRGGASIPMRSGDIVSGTRLATLDAVLADAREPLSVTRTGGEQSNSSIVFGSRAIMKVFRRVEPGPNPDFEIGRHLTETVAFSRTPAVTGALELTRPGEAAATLAMLQAVAPSQANGWDHALGEVGRYFERRTAPVEPGGSFEQDVRSALQMAAEPHPENVRNIVGSYLDSAARLGQRTAEMHLALAFDGANAAFTPEPLDAADLRELALTLDVHARQVLDQLEENLPKLADTSRLKAAEVLSGGERLLALFASLTELSIVAAKIRVHGDYHLGQVLWSENDFIILDFEGEPARPLAERRRKQSPLKDVAGMIRSFSYAAYAGLISYTITRPTEVERLEPWARLWQRWVSAAFLRAYLATAGPAPFVPAGREALARLLDAFILDKALYELQYELNSRPDWLHIPLWGILPMVR